MKRIIAVLVLALVGSTGAADSQLYDSIDAVNAGSFRGGSNRTVSTIELTPLGGTVISSGRLTRRTKSVLLASTPSWTLHSTGEYPRASYIIPQGTDGTYAYGVDYTNQKLYRRLLTPSGSSWELATSPFPVDLTLQIIPSTGMLLYKASGEKWSRQAVRTGRIIWGD